MKQSLLILFLVSIFQISYGHTKKVKLSTDEGAKIFLDGKETGTGSTIVVVPAYATVNVRIEKVGFITEERNYINDSKHFLPSTEYIQLRKDEAYESSKSTDIANNDIDIKTDKPEDEAWKLLNSIVTSTFDAIEVTDKNTGYLRTAWVTKTFESATVRTRLIVKLGNSTPLSYKVKLVSEIAPSKTSVKSDEFFKPWDRILKTFDGIIPELQSRLSKQH
jgi:hypothetical protein